MQLLKYIPRHFLFGFSIRIAIFFRKFNLIYAIACANFKFAISLVNPADALKSCILEEHIFL